MGKIKTRKKSKGNTVEVTPNSQAPDIAASKRKQTDERDERRRGVEDERQTRRCRCPAWEPHDTDCVFYILYEDPAEPSDADVTTGTAPTAGSHSDQFASSTTA